MNVRPPDGVADSISVVAVVASWVLIFTGYAAPVFAMLASIVAAIYYGIQIYDSNSIQRWLAARKQRRIDKLAIDAVHLAARAEAKRAVVALIKNGTIS